MKIRILRPQFDLLSPPHLTKGKQQQQEGNSYLDCVPRHSRSGYVRWGVGE